MCKQREKSLARLEDDGSETVLLKPTRIGANKKIYAVGVNDVVVDRKGRIYVTVPRCGIGLPSRLRWWQSTASHQRSEGAERLDAFTG